MTPYSTAWDRSECNSFLLEKKKGVKVFSLREVKGGGKRGRKGKNKKRKEKREKRKEKREKRKEKREKRGFRIF